MAQSPATRKTGLTTMLAIGVLGLGAFMQSLHIGPSAEKMASAGTYSDADPVYASARHLKHSAPRSLSPAQVRDVQRALNRQGATLEEDGLFGPRTRRAIRMYQKRHHMPPTGTLDHETQARLGLPGRGLLG